MSCMKSERGGGAEYERGLGEAKVGGVCDSAFEKVRQRRDRLRERTWRSKGWRTL